MRSNKKFIILPLIKHKMSWVDDVKIKAFEVGWPPLTFRMKSSMNENGVTACILHFNVVNTSNSIFWMVFASNINLDPPTYNFNQESNFNVKFTLTQQRKSTTLVKKRILTCKSNMRGTSVSSIFAANDKQATASNCIIQALAFKRNWFNIVKKKT